jgi:hypothetical protein
MKSWKGIKIEVSSYSGRRRLLKVELFAEELQHKTTCLSTVSCKALSPSDAIGEDNRRVACLEHDPELWFKSRNMTDHQIYVAPQEHTQGLKIDSFFQGPQTSANPDLKDSDSRVQK